MGLISRCPISCQGRKLWAVDSQHLPCKASQRSNAMSKTKLYIIHHDQTKLKLQDVTGKLRSSIADFILSTIKLNQSKAKYAGKLQSCYSSIPSNRFVSTPTDCVLRFQVGSPHVELLVVCNLPFEHYYGKRRVSNNQLQVNMFFLSIFSTRIEASGFPRKFSCHVLCQNIAAEVLLVLQVPNSTAEVQVAIHTRSSGALLAFCPTVISSFGSQKISRFLNPKHVLNETNTSQLQKKSW